MRETYLETENDCKRVHVNKKNNKEMQLPFLRLLQNQKW